MMRVVSIGMLLLALGLAGAAAAKPAPEWPRLGVETSLIFPDRTVRIADPDGDDGLWLMDRQQRWYYAKFAEPCEGLSSVGSIGYYMRGPSHLRRTSSILVDGRKCRIESLVTAAKPLPRKEREIARQAAAEGTQTP
jgi:hypothetical protein